MRNFEILFDHAESSSFDDAVYERYGKFGFPALPSDRPWIYSNFVQSLDGIASFKGRHATGGDISQMPEDRWLMDFLRAHADAVSRARKAREVNGEAKGLNTATIRRCWQEAFLRKRQRQSLPTSV